jgi:hypothetical protein
MGVSIDREKNKWFCRCGSCGRHLGPYNSEEELRENMKNWSYAFVDDMGNTRCPSCIQAAFDDQQALMAAQNRC